MKKFEEPRVEVAVLTTEAVTNTPGMGGDTEASTVIPE